MSQAVAVPTIGNLEQLLINGDLSKLNETQRLQYYKQTCDSVGLNILARPFDYITLNGKLVMYANKGCAEQLRSIRNISITVTAREMISDLFVVTANAKGPDGREDSSTGAVNVANIKGEALANAMMKAETKAKRRVTLSICGLNMLDEMEVETIPGATRGDQPAPAAVSAPIASDSPKVIIPKASEPVRMTRMQLGSEIMKTAKAIRLGDKDMSDWVEELYKKPMTALSMDEMERFHGVLLAEQQSKEVGV